MENRSVNFIPFRELLFYGKMDGLELILNVVIFIPLGIYAGVLLGGWSFGKKLVFFFLISLLVEVLQYALAIGAFDSTDIVANTSGGMIGFGLFKVIETGCRNSVKAQRLINLLAAAGTAFLLLLLLLLKLNMLPVRYR